MILSLCCIVETSKYYIDFYQILFFLQPSRVAWWVVDTVSQIVCATVREQNVDRTRVHIKVTHCAESSGVSLANFSILYVTDVTTSQTMFKRQMVIVQGPRKANRVSLDNYLCNQSYMPLLIFAKKI